MNRSGVSRLICAATLALVGALGSTRPSMATGQPDAVLDLPAGIACNFDLRIEIYGGVQVTREFENGGRVRSLMAGKGSALTFTNLHTGASLALQPNGSVIRTTYNPDGTQTVVATGHFVIILFPTDTPAGPSTIQYVGQVAYTVDASGNFIIDKVTGQSTDICAALSS